MRRNSQSDEFREFCAGPLGRKRLRYDLIASSLGEEAGDDSDND